jgi:hypothetical protein
MKTKLLLLLLFAFSFGNAQVTAGLLQEFRFDGSYTNQNSDVTFTSNGNTSFVTDRFGNANSALNIQQQGIEANFPTIPQGNQARTVSVWVVSQSTADQQVFNYGTNQTGRAYGFSVQSTSVTNFGWSNDLVLHGYSIGALSWTHIVTTFDGTTAKIYYDGVMMASGNRAWNTAASAFRLGKHVSGASGFYGYIDDLKLYNRALTDAEVLQLYNQPNENLVPIITAVSSSVTTNSATINYTLNANSDATTSVVNWGLSQANLLDQETGFSATGDTDTPGSVTINGLTPGITYFYEVRATNTSGTTTTAILNFTTNVAQALIAEYKFNNSLFNEANDSNFSAPSVANHIYTTDRFGNANSALFTSASSLYRDDIAEIPKEDKPRTISLWIRPSAVNSDNIIFTYGSASGNNVYGGSFNATNTYNFSYSSNLAFANQTTPNNWKHVVITYDASKVARIYVNGVLGSQNTFPFWWTIGTNYFYLGNSFGSATGAFNGAIDDLKIYNYALTDADVLNLYNTNTLSTSEVYQNNLEVTLHPNPVSDVLNIETALEIQSVEIYTIQGQKVVSSTEKQINVSHLASGIYLVKTQDSNNKISTNKIIIQ